MGFSLRRLQGCYNARTDPILALEKMRSNLTTAIEQVKSPPAKPEAY